MLVLLSVAPIPRYLEPLLLCCRPHATAAKASRRSMDPPAEATVTHIATTAAAASVVRAVALSGMRAFPKRWGRPTAAPSRAACRLLTADLEDHARARDLDEWTILGADNMCVGARVPDGAVIHDVSTAVRTKPNIGRAVERGRVVGADERLVTSIVASKILDLEGERLVRLRVKVDQLDLVSNFGRRRGGIRRREPKIALEGIERGTVFNRVADKRLGRKVDPGERRVCPLERQG